MKSQILLFFVVLFFVASIAAQPGLYAGFNLAGFCKYKEGKTIFVGRVISTEDISYASVPQVLKDSTRHTLKHTVSVEKIFNGQLKLQETREIFFKSGWDESLKINNEHIFIVDEISQNGSKFLKMIDWSIPLSRYSAEEKAIRFSQIESIINRYPKSPTLNGIVLQTDDTPKYSSELEIIYGYENRNFKPLSEITILAKNKKNGRLIRTKTNKKGLFTFDKLDDGDYAISIVIPKGFEQVFRYEQHKIYEIDVPIYKTTCGGPGVVFKIKKL